MVKAIKSSRLLQVLLLLNLAAILVYGGRFMYARMQRAAAREKLIQEGAAIQEKYGVMSRKDHLEFARISAASGPAGSISDEDLNSLLSMIKATYERKDGGSVVERLQLVLALAYLKHVTPPQKDAIFEACVPMFSTQNDSVSGSDRTCAIGVMKHFHDKRGIPYIKKLLTDKRPMVGDYAKKCLAILEAS